MRNTIKRREKITYLTQENGQVEVESLAREFGVSTVTIRNDLNTLHKNGLVVRTRGGAVLSTHLTRELSLKDRYSKHSLWKKAIGEAVANLITDGDSLILDSGTTIEEVAKALKGHKNLFIATNGLNISLALAEQESCEVIVTGGALRKKSFSFYGRHAEEALRNLRVDKLILGADGVDLESGITTFFEPEAALNRIMCEVSREIIAVVDSSKLNQRGFHMICGLEKISTMVTNNDVPEGYRAELEKLGIDLIIVETYP